MFNDANIEATDNLICECVGRAAMPQSLRRQGLPAAGAMSGAIKNVVISLASPCVAFNEL